MYQASSAKDQIDVRAYHLRCYSNPCLSTKQIQIISQTPTLQRSRKKRKRSKKKEKTTNAYTYVTSSVFCMGQYSVCMALLTAITPPDQRLVSENLRNPPHLSGCSVAKPPRPQSTPRVKHSSCDEQCTRGLLAPPCRTRPGVPVGNTAETHCHQKAR